jgi:hypothetical protein
VVAGKLNKEQATGLALKILRLTAKTTDAGDLRRLAAGFQAVANKLDREQSGKVAVALAHKILDGTAKTTDAYALFCLAAGFQAVADKLNRKQSSRMAAALAHKILDHTAKTTDIGELSLLGDGFKAVSGRLDNQAAVNLLKAPTCVGFVRDTLLLHLGQHRNCPFKDLWDFLHWASTDASHLDLGTPPFRASKDAVAPVRAKTSTPRLLVPWAGRHSQEKGKRSRR